jgi:hypothetical protein
MQAHEFPIRCLRWSHNDQFLVSGDDKGNTNSFRVLSNLLVFAVGVVRIWQSTMNNIGVSIVVRFNKI